MIMINILIIIYTIIFD